MNIDATPQNVTKVIHHLKIGNPAIFSAHTVAATGVNQNFYAGEGLQIFKYLHNYCIYER